MWGVSRVLGWGSRLETSELPCSRAMGYLRSWHVVVTWAVFDAIVLGDCLNHLRYMHGTSAHPA
jgi:hypothetical protein